MDEIGFSGPGAPDIKKNKGTAVPVPTFFKSEGGNPEDELTPETVETPREKAVRLDAVEALGQSQATAPKL